jgi:hypothetical protein
MNETSKRIPPKDRCGLCEGSGKKPDPKIGEVWLTKGGTARIEDVIEYKTSKYARGTRTKYCARDMLRGTLLSGFQTRAFFIKRVEEDEAQTRLLREARLFLQEIADAVQEAQKALRMPIAQGPRTKALGILSDVSEALRDAGYSPCSPAPKALPLF